MPYKDPEKQKAVQAAYYQANKLKSNALNSRSRVIRRMALAEFAREQKDVPCADCGNSYPYYVMDFDHVRGSKVGNVGRLVNQACTFETLKDEIEKCDVVCANCHRERTHSRGQTLDYVL